VNYLDFYNYWSIDLNAEQKNKDNVSNKTNLFLLRVEDALLDWIDSRSFRRIQWEDLGPEQMDALQRAIITHAMYIYRNTDVSLDSGYDPEKGVVISIEQIKAIQVSPAVENILISKGILNLKIGNRLRTIKPLI
jgi:hypothetical protein